jgi:hypothetical protein
MLSDLFQINERVFEAPTDSSHATESGALKLLALEQRLGIFDETNIVAGYGIDQMLCGRNLAEGDSEMVGIVESVHQILVCRV